MYFVCSLAFEVIARELPRGFLKRLWKVSFLASSCSLAAITHVQNKGVVAAAFI